MVGWSRLVFALGEAATVGWHSPRHRPMLVWPSCSWAVSCGSKRESRARRCHANSVDRNRAGSFLAIIFAVLGMYGTFLSLTYLLQTVDGYSPLKTGVAFLPLMVVNGLAATQLASRLMPHLRTRLLVVPGTVDRSRRGRVAQPAHHAFVVCGQYLAHRTPPRPRPRTHAGAVRQHGDNKAEPRDVGITSATTNTSQQIGASVGTALLNTVAATATAAYLSPTHTPPMSWRKRRCTGLPWPACGRLPRSPLVRWSGGS